MFVKISSIFFIFSHAPFHALAKTCFAPDGSVADDTYQPCITIEGVESMCCSLNSTTPDTWTSRLTICDGGAYCYGTDKSCCLEGTTFKLAPTLVSIGNTTTATTTATATVTTTATATVTSNVSGSSKVAIGAGVGVPLAVLAVVMLGAGFLWGGEIRRWNSMR
ncbi:hypothetical protein N7497_012452 [Penicillium chrysogenum]|nr:hypothetical protein N7497_012452 [Penicillium chrysogenum]